MTLELWKSAYKTALEKQDINKLAEAVLAAEGAIFVRLQEIFGKPEYDEERTELDGATKDLLVLEVQKLGWPDPTKSHC